MKSIRTQMLVYLLLGTMVLFSIMFYIFETKIQDLPEYIKDQYMEVTVARSSEIGNELKGFVNQAAMISQSPIIKSMNLQEIKPYLSHLPLDSRHKSMTIAYPDGTAWSTIFDNINISDQEQFEKIFVEDQNHVICQPFYSPYTYNSNTPIIIVAHSIKDDNEKTIGLVNIVIETYFLDKALKNMKLKARGYGWVVNNEGLIISHPDPHISLVGNIKERIKDIDKKEKSFRKEFGNLEYVDENGEEMIAFFSKIEGSPDWTFMLSIPEKEIYKEINSIQNSILISGAIILLLLLTFLIVLSKSLTEPVLELREVFEKAANGNLDIRADEKASYEWGDTAKSFNKMLDQIKELTYMDKVTGLYNYNSFLIMLPDKIKALSDKGSFMKIVMISIDDFKRVNRMIGYKMGDKVLRNLGARLGSFLSTDEMLARFLGDEFIFLVCGDNLREVEMKIRKIWQLCGRNISVKENKFILTFSLGSSDIVKKDTCIDRAIHEATTAMHTAKKEGGNIAIPYNAQLDELIKQEQKLEKDLIYAIENQELKLAYQPIVGTRSGRIIATEALLRWKHAELGYIPPPKIIRIAEQSGLIVEIGRFVLEEAISQNKKWQDKGYPFINISVNVSAIQLEQEGFVDMVCQILDEVGLEARYLEIEITETNIMDGVNKKMDKIKRLRDMGVGISIDDFGTGYSSLAYLAQFPINTLKIDRSFVVDMLEKENAKSIVMTIIKMSKAINVKTTAEGVETMEQLESLQKDGCDKIQGYLFSRPIFSHDMDKILKMEYLSPSQ